MDMKRAFGVEMMLLKSTLTVGRFAVRVVDEIASNGDSCAVFVFLSFTVDTDDSPVGDVTLAFFGDVVLAHEENCFCSGC
jgi:hypothetical protein